MTHARVLVAMSGGVDSSITAALLKEQDFDVIGITMQLVEQSHRAGGCCGLDGILDAKRVAHALGIPHYVVNFRERFRDTVITNFCEEYRQGRTPNPCIRCNQYLKFDDLLRKADELGAAYIATGHYARIEKDPETNHYMLKKGVDEHKDQSYFLYMMAQAQLRRTLMPLGALTKSEVRKLAEQWNLPVAQKEESQEICFIPDDDYRSFLRQHIPEAIVPGPIMDMHGNVIGQHQGLPFYTIGQRRGLGIAAGEPLYVTVLDTERNILVAGRKAEVYRDTCAIHDLHWTAGPPTQYPVPVKAKIRYRHYEAAARIILTDDTTLEVIFRAPQKAITPGQAIVFYHDDVVLGGGTIMLPSSAAQPS